MSQPVSGTAAPVPRRRRGVGYVPALGPKMKALLLLIFAAVAVLGASGVYLVALRLLEWRSQHSYETQFSLWMFLLHLAVGVVILVPFVFFGIVHLLTSRNRPNRVAVKLGILLFVLGLIVCASGVVLLQLDGMPQLPTGTIGRWVAYGLHVAAPVLAVAVYVLHRRAGPAIRWRWGIGWGVAVAIFVGAMMHLHSLDPRQWYAKGSPEGAKYFEPSKALTVGANFIPAETLMMDEYCMKCHQDVYKDHIHSVHKFSSFNNPAYLFSVQETRRISGVRASRWCAGCHDPVPFFSGAFDDPNFDMKNDPTANAGITCTVCHAITNINSRSGNADYTIDEPIHYPFAYSKDPVLQWVNNQLVKAKPDFHKQMFLKPFHRDNEKFCSTCHKVGVPQEVNHYKEFLRGQNHPDSYWLSGVSGYGARSFYYPAKAKKCSDCHMPLHESNDFGSRDFDGSGQRKVHNHLFVGANTGMAALLQYQGWEDIVAEHNKFLQGGIDGKSPTLRIDIFGLKHVTDGDADVSAPLLGDEPLRPQLPQLKPGGNYLVEVVVRTLNMGHHFTQGTADSNEVWAEVTARAGGKVIGKSGSLSGDNEGKVDPWSHFLNVLMLDRHGNRIDRRNPQDIFTPLYDHQIPPGAANVIHYQFQVPQNVTGPIEIEAKIRYRKFDYTYMEHVFGKDKVPKLPIVDLCQDKVILPVKGVQVSVPEQESPITPAWQRWNDYGIACFLEGGPEGKKGGELGQAEKAFKKLLSPAFKSAKEAHAHAYLNLARVYFANGDIGQDGFKRVSEMLYKASKSEPPAPWWTVSWYYGLVNMANGNYEEAVKDFKRILDPKNQDKARGFNFGNDWVVINALGESYYQMAFHAEGEERQKYVKEAIAQFERTLDPGMDPENIAAHHLLHKTLELMAAESDHTPAPPPQSKSGAEQTLAELTSALADGKRPSATRSQFARDLLQALPGSASKCRPAVLAVLRQKCFDAAQGTDDDWLRLSIAPVINDLDGYLLATLPDLGAKLASKDPVADRLQAADDLVRLLTQLDTTPPPAKVKGLMAGPASLPKFGLPFNLGLQGLADHGLLEGPLPPPRLLKLQALRQQIHSLLDDPDPQIRAATAQVLSWVHLLMHGIYRLDENAAGQAVQIHRASHPAADHASHSIIIYQLKS